MHPGIFMAGESDMPKLALRARLDQSSISALVIKDAMRIFVAKDFMMLHKIDAVYLQAFQGFI
jgi:hypothetical protein